MKTRIKGDLIRFRLSQSEVDRLCAGEEVTNKVLFSPDTSLAFVLTAKSNIEVLSFMLTEYAYIFYIPEYIIENWKAPDQVTIKEKVSNGTRDGLTILIEKDFKCLNVRVGEDESDLFPNPAAKEL
jgi:hypothetical protein